MTFTQYQKSAIATKKQWDDPKFERMYLAMSIAGEAGEVIEIIKKHVRDGTEINLEKLKLELGDVLWYIAALSDAFDLNLDDVAVANIDKLRKRHGESFSGYGDRSGE